MQKRFLLVTSLILATASAPLAHATPIVYTAALAGANEVPPTGSTGTGTAIFTLDGNSLEIQLTFSGLSAPASAGHIHCCAAPGSNAIVAVPFLGLPNATSGTYTNTVDLSLASTYTAAFITASGGTVASADAALIAGLNNDTTYANLHNVNFPGGEIRGFILPAAVPEPSSLILLGTGLAGLAEAVRRRTRACR